jgi:transcriptional regulator with XRE-family HTH domain
MKEDNIVKQVCQELNINQAELARKLGVSPARLSEYRNGKKRIPKLVNVALNLLLENKILKEDSELLNLFAKRVTKEQNYFL